MKQFIETKNRFLQAFTNINFPITYETWYAIKDEYKAAALYVNFFDAITMAWVKARAEFTPAEDGVSIVLQYLEKNVSIIIANPKKFTPAYINTVAYNCMGCLRRVQRDANYFNMTVSQYANGETSEIDLFEKFLDDSTDVFTEVCTSVANPILWKLIDSLDSDHLDVLEYLLGNPKLKKRVEKKYNALLTDLQSAFKKFLPIYCNEHNSDTVHFAHIWNSDDNIKSAVVEMVNGVKATYYGETREMPNGAVRVVFFGPDQDYIIPLERAKSLKVVDVELY